MERNFKNTVEKTESYLGDKIISGLYRWEEFNDKKQKWENKKEIYCHLYRVGSRWQPLNLGQCNDGGKFTAVNQSINQAKVFIDCCNENGW